MLEFGIIKQQTTVAINGHTCNRLLSKASELISNLSSHSYSFHQTMELGVQTVILMVRKECFICFFMAI